jgi:signal transduction histidine kinase
VRVTRHASQRLTLAPMSATPRPEAIDSRLVFHVYACSAIPAGVLVYMWPLLVGMERDGDLWFAPGRIAAAGLAASGCCAAAFAKIEEPLANRRALLGFAHAHILFGVMVVLQWVAVLSPTVPALVGWGPLLAGFVLLYLAITGPGADFTPGVPPLQPDGTRPGATVFAVRNKPAIGRLRSEYEQQIRQAARQEERARLARDLHDAVKQQLFVIQTAGATAQARLATDPDGARVAVDQVRAAAREAMTEMEVMLEQLQAAPIANAGLLAVLKKHCEALGFRTGSEVTFVPGTLPDEHALEPGAREAIARVAQEALSNVARHARARKVTVSLGTAAARLMLTVQDDGSGFSEVVSRGMGMSNIAARAAEVGGTFEVASAPGGGTTVRFSVPCRQAASARPYAIRAAAWGATFLGLSGFMLSRGAGGAPTWLTAIVLIAAIAAARYCVAVYWLVQRRRPA